VARIPLPAGDADDVVRLYSMGTPELSRAAAMYSAAVYHHSSIPLRLRELMRYRIALINQCTVCMETRLEGADEIGMSDDDYTFMETWRTHDGFTDVEKLVIEFAELYCLDHLAIDQAFFDRLLAVFTPDQVQELGLCVASWLALGRLTAVYDAGVACALRLDLPR
jgi:alkylhydroperoxidase family enzyme